MKIVLTIIAVAVVTLVLLVGGAYYWFDANKDEYQAALKESVAKGREYGSGKGQSQCVAGLMDYIKPCEGMMRCQFVSVGYIRGCMLKASDDDFCKNLPASGDFMKTVAWSMNECKKYDLNKNDCQQYIQGFVQFCHEPGQAPAVEDSGGRNQAAGE